MNKKSYSQVLDQVARDGLAANPDLTPRILARIRKGQSTTMRSQMKVFVTVFLILLVVVIGLVSVPAVRAAIQRWIGYVPDIGLVTEGQIRVLAEPVSITREEVTLKVEQVLVDSNRTTVLYSVEGLSMDMLDTSVPRNRSSCHQDAILRVPGRELSPGDHTGTSWITGYQQRVSYPVIPADVKNVTLVMPCVRSALPGKAPENWEVAFRLMPAPPDMTAFPVIEISAPVETTATPAPQADPGASIPADGISLALERAVQMDDGYLLYAALHWENTGFSYAGIFDFTALHLLDANGQELPYSLDYEAMSDIPYQRGQTPFVIKTAPILVGGPLALVIDSVAVTVPVPGDASFTFDPGPDPQPGQVWELNADLEVGYGHSLRVLRAIYPTPPAAGLPQQAGFSFELQSESGVTNAMLFDKSHPLGGGGGGGSFSKVFTSGFSYQGTMPEGPITVTVESVSVNLPGPWEATWTPPALQSRPVSENTACLTRESWERALQAHPSLPTGLGGTLAIAHLVPPGFQYEVSVTRLDGTGLKSIGPGFAPSLAPDGKRVVHTGPAVNGPADGLYITDLTLRTTSRLPGTTTGDMDPLWSPDGHTIAFTRGPGSGLIGAPGPYSILVINSDGSNLRALATGSELSYALAWMPDSLHLLYSTPEREGVSLHMLDVQTGAVSALFDINYNGTVSISPDGKRLAFEEMLPLDKYGLFVSNVDGSNRIQVADGDPYVVTHPAWSPDGNWLIASVHDLSAGNQPNPALALILVDACQIIPVPGLGGYVNSWLP